MSDLDDIDDLDNTEDLKAVLCVMQKRISDLEGRVDALHNAREYLFDELDGLRKENNELKARLSDIGGHVELVDASLSSGQKGKIEKVNAILSYAHNDRGLPAKTTVKTGEATAAAGASRDTALRLMDEIAANFDWAKTENPGGPNPKKLKLDLPPELDDVKAEVRSHYAAGEA